MTKLIAALVIAMLLAADARAAIEDTQPPVVSFIPCEAFQRGRVFTVFARFEDASPLFDPKLVYRLTGESTWRHTAFKLVESGAWRAAIPPRELTAALEYFVEVFDENGNGPTRVGAPEKPLFARATRRAPECAQPDDVPMIATAPIEEVGTADSAIPSSLFAPAPVQQEASRCQSADRPLYCKPWFWIAAGGAAVATAAVIAIAADHGDRGYPDHVDIIVGQRAAEARPR